MSVREIQPQPPVIVPSERKSACQTSLYVSKQSSRLFLRLVMEQSGVTSQSWWDFLFVRVASYFSHSPKTYMFYMIEWNVCVCALDVSRR